MANDQYSDEKGQSSMQLWAGNRRIYLILERNMLHFLMIEEMYLGNQFTRVRIIIVTRIV
jgi:hypothetical protein